VGDFSAFQKPILLLLASFRIIPKENDGQEKHQKRPDDPVQNQGNAQDFHVFENFWKESIINFCKRRYIIRIKPIAIGILVVPELIVSIHSLPEGKK